MDEAFFFLGGGQRFLTGCDKEENCKKNSMMYFMNGPKQFGSEKVNNCPDIILRS